MISISPRGEETDYSEKSAQDAKLSELFRESRESRLRVPGAVPPLTRKPDTVSTTGIEPATRPSNYFRRSDLRRIHFQGPLHPRGCAKG